MGKLNLYFNRKKFVRNLLLIILRSWKKGGYILMLSLIKKHSMLLRNLYVLFIKLMVHLFKVYCVLWCPIRAQLELHKKMLLLLLKELSLKDCLLPSNSRNMLWINLKICTWVLASHLLNFMKVLQDQFFWHSTW